MSRHAYLWLGAFAGILICSASHAATVLFDNRQNVDLLNSDAVVLTSNTTNPQSLIGEVDIPSFWEGFGASANIAMDLGESRNVKTIKMNAFFTQPYGMSSATVETAPSGAGPWTVVPATVSTADSDRQTNIVLSNSADTRFLRLTRGTAAPGNTENRWVLNNLRVYGDTGATLNSGNHLDIISSSAFSAPGAVSITTSGSVSDGGGGPFPDDNPSLLYRKVFYTIGNGDSIRIAFDRDIDFDKFGFAQAGGFYDPSAAFHFQVWGAQDVGGTNFTTLLLDRTGPEPAGPTFFDLPLFTGRALRFDIINNAGGVNADLRIGDLFVTVPEPTAASSVVMAATCFFLRRRPSR